MERDGERDWERERERDGERKGEIERKRVLYRIYDSVLILLFNRLSQNVCIDERIIWFKERHFLKQYIANKKAHRWGVKAWILAKSHSGYAHHVQIYQGNTTALITHKVKDTVFSLFTLVIIIKLPSHIHG